MIQISIFKIEFISKIVIFIKIDIKIMILIWSIYYKRHKHFWIYHFQSYERRWVFEDLEVDHMIQSLQSDLEWF